MEQVTMNVPQILEAVQAAGAQLRIVENRLKVTPPGRLSPALRAAIQGRLDEVKARIEADRVARLDAERNTRDKAAGRGYDCAGFQCPRCLNDSARCEWCADHAGDPGVGSCGDCERGHMKPAGVSWRRGIVPDVHDSHIPESIREKIEAIEVEARALGWNPERLWNSNFWDQPRGLPAMMDEGDELGAVTENFIEVLKSQKTVWRFPRRTS
jgi:hypothetical protein